MHLVAPLQAEGHLDSAKDHAGKAASELVKATKASASDVKGRASATADDAKHSSKSAASNVKVGRGGAEGVKWGCETVFKPGFSRLQPESPTFLLWACRLGFTLICLALLCTWASSCCLV